MKGFPNNLMSQTSEQTRRANGPPQDAEPRVGVGKFLDGGWKPLNVTVYTVRRESTFWVTMAYLKKNSESYYSDMTLFLSRDLTSDRQDSKSVNELHAR